MTELVTWPAWPMAIIYIIYYYIFVQAIKKYVCWKFIYLFIHFFITVSNFSLLCITGFLIFTYKEWFPGVFFYLVSCTGWSIALMGAIRANYFLWRLFSWCGFLISSQGISCKVFLSYFLSVICLLVALWYLEFGLILFTYM